MAKYTREVICLKYKRRKSNVSKYICFSDEKSKKSRVGGSAFKRKFLMAALFALIILSLSRLSVVNSSYVRNVFTQSSGGRLEAAVEFFNKTGSKIADLCYAVFLPSNDKKTNAFAEKETEKKSDGLSQEAPKDEDKEINFVFAPTNPCPGRISSEFGERVHPLNNDVSFHNGIDIAGTEGTEIRACFDGTVETSEYNEFSGNYIIINHSEGYTSSYAHMKECIAKKGEKVKKGQLIGVMGATGNATGSHLHFEIRKDGTPLNPMELIGK